MTHKEAFTELSAVACKMLKGVYVTEAYPGVHPDTELKITVCVINPDNGSIILRICQTTGNYIKADAE